MLRSPPPPGRASEPLPAVLHHVFSAGLFFERLSLYAGRSLSTTDSRWVPLRDWWQRSIMRPTEGSDALRALVLRWAPEIEADVAALRRFEPPATPLPGTRYGTVYEQIASRYRRVAEKVQLRATLPGPLTGGRHPGFELSFYPKRRELVAEERASRLCEGRLAWRVFLPLRPDEPLRFGAGDLHAFEALDAWQLLAMRAVLLGLAERREDDAAVRALEDELTRPLWEHMLTHLAGTPAEAAAVGRGDEPRRPEWAFCLAPTFRVDDFVLVPFSRTASRAKTTKWKKQTFETVYAEAGTELERDIARVALCALSKVSEAHVPLGRPQGHELLRLLAQHPRVFVTEAPKPAPDTDALAALVVGEATMRLEPGADGALSPRFLVGGREVRPDQLLGHGTASVRASARGHTLVSAYVPAPLRKWLDASIAMGDALAFPAEAIPELARATEPLVASGLAELPKEALGAELPYEPTAALRVDWQTDGRATVEVVVAVHPRAPLVAPGAGPRLFTFLLDDRRVFVERDLGGERGLVERTRDAVAGATPLLWSDAVGRTETFEDALALAAWLDENPLGLPIEVKIGRPPRLVGWQEATRRMTARREGSWLHLDGHVDVGGAKLTVGDVLEAARLARRYVKVADGTFLELSEAAREKLHAVAIAAELGATKDGRATRVHEAFGALVADAADVMGAVGGADLGVYARRLEASRARVRVPRLEEGELRDYQREGVAWMLRLATWAPGCVLADDMGLGKTVQAATLLKARAALGPALVVAPASVSSNWVAELARFMPSLVLRWYNDERELAPDALGKGEVLVVSYGLLQRRAARFATARWATVVLDEAQYVKNTSAERTSAVRAIPRDFTVALTGTPLENHLGELFSIVDLAFPGLLGDEAVFRDRFRKPIESGKDGARLATLAKLLTPFLLRRTRASVLEELPERQDITEHLELAPDETKRYLALRTACELQFAKRKGGETQAQLKIALLAALMRLRQLACDVRLVDPSFQGSTTKISRAVELAQQIADEGSHVLVFSQFTQLLTRVRDALLGAGLRVGYLDGETPTAKRRPLVEQFQRGELDVFCVSLLAGGTGLNLTRASYVIHLDPWWNPAAEEQATSRAHRMGQTEPVTVYRLVARGTIEEAVLAMHGTKRELAAAVLDGKANARAISSDELLDLLRFGA